MDYEAEFSRRLKGLNAQQRQAVDIISGPLMVVAGPGTGKTELLTMRVANILDRTDTDPASILCLTFTESAAGNMTKRLSGIIGSVAYQVEICTFHGFGSSIIGRHSEYFYDNADYQPADPLTQLEILTEVIDQLSFDNPLRVRDPKGKPIYLAGLQKLIRNFKDSGLTAEQLELLVKQNIDFCHQAEPFIRQAFADKISKKTISLCQDLATEIERLADETPTLDFAVAPSLAQLFYTDLTRAIDEAEMDNTTKPITAFKRSWLANNDRKEQVMKIEEPCHKLSLAIDIYRQYIVKMNERQLYDFSDMINQVIRAIEEHPGLKADLQEQYQYIMVDEFQDTNGAQMHLLNLLADYDDQPNLMVVGDDDQAIYRFQGADIGNIQSFAERYPRLCQINLSQNYRSGADIVELATKVAGDISQRLTNADGTPKELIAHHDDYDCKIDWTIAVSEEQELDQIARQIKRAINTGSDKPNQIAVIARHHKSLAKLTAFLTKYDITFSYERQQDVFSSELIRLLLALARTIVCIAEHNINDANAYLATVVAHPAFGLSGEDFYRLSLSAQKKWGDWFESLAQFKPALVHWLKDQAVKSVDSSLEVMCAGLMNITNIPDDDDFHSDRTSRPLSSATSDYTSPIYQYYFAPDKLARGSLAYLSFLSDFSTLSQALEQYHPDRKRTLKDLLVFADRYAELGGQLQSTFRYGRQESVQLLSAHKAKGLEFDTVYLMDAESEEWGSKSRGGGDKIKLPPNMPFDNAGDTDDERRRLFFVALTRAKRNLHLFSHKFRQDKELNQLEYGLEYIKATEMKPPEPTEATAQLATGVFSFLLDSKLDKPALLADRLENYSLSASDLNTFTNLQYGGPETFLFQNLLRIPQAQVANQLFGTAIHAVMQSLHNYAMDEAHPNQLPPIDVTYQVFSRNFDINSLDEATAKVWIDKGHCIIDAYYEQRQDSFRTNQRAELKLEATIDDGVRLKGKLDAVTLNQAKRQAIITDYKTGKPFLSFTGKGKSATHQYENQLAFYKLLFENSPKYHDWQATEGIIEFVTPDANDGQLIAPRLNYADDVDMEHFTRLVIAVYHRITRLDLPDISEFKKTPAGTLEFEKWLIEHD